MDSLELDATQATRLKAKAEAAVSTEEELAKAKDEAIKLTEEVELAKKGISEEFEKLKAEHTDLQKSSVVVAGKCDRLIKEVDKLKVDNGELIDVKVLIETTIQVKDIYLSHLAFLLESHLSALPTDIADEIQDMPKCLAWRLSPRNLSFSRVWHKVLVMLRLMKKMA